MKDFDIIKPDRVEKHQDAVNQKEYKYYGRTHLRKGMKVFSYLDGKVTEIEKKSKALVDTKGKVKIKSKAHVHPDAYVVIALNRKNAIRKFKKFGLEL